MSRDLAVLVDERFLRSLTLGRNDSEGWCRLVEMTVRVVCRLVEMTVRAVWRMHTENGVIETLWLEGGTERILLRWRGDTEDTRRTIIVKRRRPLKRSEEPTGLFVGRDDGESGVAVIVISSGTNASECSREILLVACRSGNARADNQ